MRYANIYIYIFVLHRGFFQQPRPRVGICLSRLDALTGKYNIHFLIAKLGHRTPVGNADAGTRRPQVRTRRPQVRTYNSALKKIKGSSTHERV